MNAKADHRSAGATARNAARASVGDDLATMERVALLTLVEALFCWALTHTGLTRQQIIAPMQRDAQTPP